MYSMQGDTVLDPYLGTGTTSLAAIASNRNSLGYEIDPMFLNIITDNIETTEITFFRSIIQNRINGHINFVTERNADLKKGDIKHYNENLKLPVMTNQETEIKFNFVTSVERKGNQLLATYNTVKPQNVEFTFKQPKGKEKTLFDL